MKSKSSSEYFGEFLRSIQESEQRQDLSSFSSSIPFKLMAALADLGPQDPASLMTASGLGFDEFTEVVKSLRVAGLIEVEGSAGYEKIELNSKATQLIQVLSLSKDDVDEEGD